MEIVSNQPIDPGKVYELIKKDTAGSVVLHFAVVRGSTDNRTTSSIEFHAGGDIEGELSAVGNDIRQKWDVEDLLIIRRVGRLDIGDIISLIAASSPHRDNAFEACRYGIERLKAMKTIVKNETFL
ncbi:molybdenum cofactor biosynthesis protein MoaE [Chloroflexota bacterium]